MARDFAGDELYRIRIVFTHPDGPATTVVQGPWPNLGTAKGQRTALLNRYANPRHYSWYSGSLPGPSGATPEITVERATITWEEI